MKRKPTQLPASLKTIDVKAILRKRGVYVAQKQNKALKEAAMPMARKLIESKHKVKEAPRHAQFTNEVVMEYWEKQIHIVEIVEKKFEAKLQQFVVKIADGFLKHFEQEVSNQKSVAKDYFSDTEEEWLVAAQLDFTPLLMDQAILAGQEAYKLIGSKDVYLPDTFRAKVADNVRKFTSSMLDTDRDALVNIITHGLEAGKSVPEIRNQIETDFKTNYSKMQAERITRTEVLRVSNQAALDAYEQSGVVEGKQWLTAGAIDECAQYEGQIESLSGNFYGDTNEFQDGDPPLHPNCRCVVLPVIIDQKGYQPAPVYERDVLNAKIKELEEQVDKRTKAFKELQEDKSDDQEYINELEALIDENNS